MITQTADAHRQQLIQRLEAGDCYRFITAAEPYLRACPDDHWIRVMAVREYLKLGLVDPARELIESGSSSVEPPAELVALREQMAHMRGGLVPWSRYADRFEANLRVLAGRGIDVAAIRDQWAERQAGFQLFRDRNGIIQVRMLAGENRWRWIPCLGNHRADADGQPLPDEIKGNMPGPYLFEGIDLGWYFRRVYDATRDTFLGYGCALFVVEPDPAMWAVALHIHDWAELLADPRVFVFVGHTCTEELSRTWDADLDLPWPQRSFRFSEFRSGCSPSALEVVRKAGKQRDNEFAASAQDLEDRYASRDLSYWANRFDQALSGSGPPLRILAAVSIHTTFLQYSMRDARSALEAMGHECTVLTETTNYQVTGPMTFHNAIRSLDPDLFFILDHLRPEFGAVIPANLPILTWDQDCLPQVFTKSNLDRIAAHDFIVGCSKSRFLTMGYDGRQYLNATVPTSPEQFGGVPLSEEEQGRFACDVSYVSHASQTARAFHEQERSRYKNPTLVRLLDTMYQMMPDKLAKHGVAGGALCVELLDEVSRTCGIQIHDQELRQHLTEWYLWRLGDRMFRHEALKWAADWAGRTGRSLRIYGNGWDEHPTLAPFAAGPAQNGRELLCIHRASRINLQLMPAGFLHQRSMDGLASGGFFLARATPNDTIGHSLWRLAKRIGTLGITTTAELLDSPDETVQSLLQTYWGDSLRRVDRTRQDLFFGIQTNAELEHPCEVFPRFRDILFNSEAEFLAKVEGFLADDGLRNSLTHEMRQVVIDRFSYGSAMERFLRAMGGYLRDASSKR